MDHFSFLVAGQEDYDRLRPLSYPQTDVFLLLFSIVNPPSLDSVIQKWYPEVFFHCPTARFLLVGVKSGFRDDPKTVNKLASNGVKPLTYEEGLAAALEVGADKYVECDAMTRVGLVEAFESAVRLVFTMSDSRFRKTPDVDTLALHIAPAMIHMRSLTKIKMAGDVSLMLSSANRKFMIPNLFLFRNGTAFEKRERIRQDPPTSSLAHFLTPRRLPFPFIFLFHRHLSLKYINILI